MTAIIILIVCSLFVAGGFLFAFLISVKSGQYDDTYTPAVRMLFEENETDDIMKEPTQASKYPGAVNHEIQNDHSKILNPKP